MSDKWDRHFINLALENAKMSKDPSTRVGAVIVGPDREVRSMGFNGFPRGIADTQKRLMNRDTKLSIIVHGEMNAVLNAARIGTSLKDCILYFACTDDSGVIWGGAPCIRCTVELIQTGIKEIVSLPFKDTPSRWKESIEAAQLLLAEANIHYRTINFSKE